MKKKKSGRNKQRTANKAIEEPNEIKKAPHTYVIHRGLSCKYFLILILLILLIILFQVLLCSFCQEISVRWWNLSLPQPCKRKNPTKLRISWACREFLMFLICAYLQDPKRQCPWRYLDCPKDQHFLLELVFNS